MHSSRLTSIFVLTALEFVAIRSTLFGVKETLEDFRTLEIESPQDLDLINANNQISGVTVTQTYFLQRVSVKDRNKTILIADQHFNSSIRISNQVPVFQFDEIASVRKVHQNDDILDLELNQYMLDPEAKRTLSEYFKTIEQNLENKVEKLLKGFNEVSDMIQAHITETECK